ncbi:MAG: hypothetical protein ACQEUY_16655 [Pseudomonadota bacterium]
MSSNQKKKFVDGFKNKVHGVACKINFNRNNIERAKRVAIIDVTRGSLFKLSKYLVKEGVEPVMWMGYAGSKVLPKVSEAYPECEIYDYWRFNKGGSFFCNDLFFSADKGVLLTRQFLSLKEKTVKMMDRNDRSGRFRYQEREAFFYSLFNFFYSKVKEKDVQLVISAHSPHLPATMVFYGVCQILGIKTVHVREIPNAPFCYLATDYTNSFLKTKSSRSIRNENLPLLVDDACEIAKRYKEPFYMTEQKKSYTQPEVSSLKKINYSELSKSRFYYSPPEKPIRYDIDSVDFLDDSPTVIFDSEESVKEGVISFKKDVSLLQWHEYYDLKEDVSLQVPFVFFPLHYEPEKTSNPDGGEYYNSYEAIVALRNFVPNDIPIYIKEHITQFHDKYDGYKGRSPYFYRAIKNLPNIKFVDTNITSRELIESALVTVSQTGTACFEAACIQKKAVVMGDVWFSSLPNVFRFCELNDFDELMEEKNSNIDEVVDKIKEWAGTYCINGYVTGSFIRLHNKKHPDRESVRINTTCKEIASTLKMNGYI